MAGFALKPITAGVALALSVPAMATQQAIATNLPSGGTIVAGNGSITSDGRDMTIQQNTDKLIANWQDFSIGADNSVTFYQPSSSSVALNRVLGQNPSEILGNLNANGQVFLVNPNGVVIGEGASVRTGAFVASSLELSDEKFLGGDYRFSGNGADIVNKGSIDGAVVALISPNVSNEGTIKGDAALAAGTDVFLDFNGDGLLSVEVEASTVETLVENRGLIRADGGLAILTAKGASDALKGVVNNTGTVQAQTLENKNGRILLLGDMDNGEANIAGTLDASAPDGGDGGFIETSAAKVSIDDSATITTAASTGAGETGTWLIDPKDFTVAASGGDITGAALSSQLADNNVEIQSVNGAAEGMGDIFVDDTITWDQNTLTLNAERNIEINSELFGSGTAGLTLKYNQADAGGDYFVNAPVNLASTGSFSTRNGNAGDVIDYTILTELGAEGSSTGTDLQGMLDGNFVLGADIDAAATADWEGGFAPVGISNVYSRRYFDGLGHVIHGLTIDRPEQSYSALFRIGRDISIRHIGLENVNITGSTYSAALLADSREVYIGDAYATGTVNGESIAGGLVGGLRDSTIERSGAEVSVTGTKGVGGLVGYSDDGSHIRESWANGDVLATAVYGPAGGLVGRLHNESSVSHSWATGDVEGDRGVGGLVGASYTQSSVTQSHASGMVTGGSEVGGLVGRSHGMSVTDSYAEGGVTGTEAGGLVGSSVNNTITGSYAVGSVSGNVSIGGLVGVSESSTISDSHAEGSVSASIRNAGGLVGHNHSGSSVSDSWAAGKVFVEQRYGGGLVGFNENGSISRSYATGRVEGARSIGGLVGLNGTAADEDAVGTINQSWASGDVVAVFDGSEGFTVGFFGGLAGANVQGSSISQSYATGNVEGPSALGGLVGFDNSGTISQSWSSGNVVGETSVGGLLGRVNSDSTVEQSYSTGSVITSDASEYAGGLVGEVVEQADTTVSFADSYYATTDALGNAINTGTNFNSEGSGWTLVELMDVATFSGWDIDAEGGTETAWRIYQGYSTPLLRPLLTELVVDINDAAVTYNGTHQSSNAGFSASAEYDSNLIMGGEITGGGRNAGDYTITLGDIYSGQQGYDLVVNSNEGTLTIAPASLAISTSEVVKTYDGTTAAAGTAIVDAGILFGSDSLDGASFAFADKNAGNGKTVSVSGAVITDGNGGNNYDVTYVTNTNSTISKAQLNFTGVTAEDKVYDGTTDAVLNLDGLDYTVFGDDEVNLEGGLSGQFADKNAGDNKTVELTAALGGADAGNYQLGEYTDLTASIARREITGSITAGDKVYDGTTAAATNGSLDGVIAGDTVDFDTSGSFADRHVGENKTITLDYGFTGADAGNYSLSGVNDTTTAAITAASLTIGVGDVVKTYDGTTAAAGTAIVDAGTLFGSDSLEGASFAFADKNAGSGKTVNIANAIIDDGNGGNNYDVIYVANTSSSIDKAQLTFTGVTAGDKVYDGTTDAVLNLDGLDYTVFGDDDVSLESGLSAQFADKNAGDNKTVELIAALGGADAGNYQLGEYADLTASIARREITGSVTAGDKVYDGTVAAATSGSLDGVIAGDTVDFNTSGNFADRHAGENKSVDLSYDFGGTDAANYDLIDVNGTTTASITPATLVLSAVFDTKLHDRTTTSDGIVVARGLVEGDGLGNLSQSFDSADIGDRTLLVDEGYALNDGNGGNNYQVVLENAEGRILPLVTGGGAGGLLSARRSIATVDPQQNPADLLTYGPVIVNNEDPQLEE